MYVCRERKNGRSSKCRLPKYILYRYVCVRYYNNQQQTVETFRSFVSILRLLLELRTAARAKRKNDKKKKQKEKERQTHRFTLPILNVT